MHRQRISILAYLFAGLLLSATGCMCVDHRGGCGAGCGCDLGNCSGGCDSCGGFTPGPLSRLVSYHSSSGCSTCAGGGCGELYVDEWINERPTVDNCGCGECLTCGRQPVRSLLNLILGDRYAGSCETCDSCGGGVDLGSPWINDGYDPTAWKSNRGCNCGSTASGPAHHHETEVGETIHEGASESGTVKPTQPAPVPSPETPESGSSVKKSPTPAPPIPKSAMRLNPASRKVIR